MADFAVPFVNQVAKAKDDQEQARASQQMMQVAQLALYRQKQDELEADREFKAYGAILTNPDFPDEMKVVAANRMGQRMGIQGEVTLEGLRPFTGMMREAMNLYGKGGDNTDWSVLGPMSEMLTANSRWITPKLLPELAAMNDAYKGYQAGVAVDLSNPAPSRVTEASAAMKQREVELTEMRQQRERWEATVYGKTGEGTWAFEQAPYANANAKKTAQEQLDRLRTMEEEQMNDEATVNEDTHRKELNARVARIVKSSPDMIKVLEKQGLQGLGIYPSDENFIKSRYYRLLQLPDNVRTPEQTQELEGIMTYMTGKSPSSQRNTQMVALLTEQQQQLKVEKDRSAEVRTIDQKAQEVVAGVRANMTELLAPPSTQNLTTEEVAMKGAETRGFATFLGAQQQAMVEQNKDKVVNLTTDAQRLQADVEDSRRRLGTTPFNQRDDLKAKIRLKEDLIAARSAQAALLSTHNPLAGIDLEWEEKIERQKADQAKAALGTAGLTSDEKATLEHDFAEADGKATKAKDDLKAWTAERNKHLATLTQTHARFEDESQILRQKMTGTQRAMEKDEQTTGLYTAVVTDMSADRTLSLTDAVKRNLKDYPAAEVKKVADDATKFFKYDYDKANYEAQAIFTGLIGDLAGNELTPQQLSRAAKTASDRIEKQTGIRVGVDDIMKAYQATTNTTILKSPESSRKDALEIHQAVTQGVTLIDGMLGGITKNPGAVGTAGNISQFIAGISQQVAAFTADVEKNGQSLKKLKSYSSKPTDDLESAQNALIYLVARALSPVGVISDQDAERAERTVGNIKDWGRGYEQAINKLTFVRGFLLGKDEMAEQVYHNQDPWNPTPQPKAKDAAPSTGAPAGQPKNADEFFKLHPKLLQGAVR